MRGRAAIGVDDDLAAGQAGVAVGAADDELAGRVDVPVAVVGDLQVAAAPRGCTARRPCGPSWSPSSRRDAGSTARSGDFRPACRRRSGRSPGSWRRGRACRRRPRPSWRAAASSFEDLVRVVDRRRHQVRRLAAGVAEHDALVAGTLVALLVGGIVDALGDIGRLARAAARRSWRSSSGSRPARSRCRGSPCGRPT